MLADPELPASPNYPETIVLPLCAPRSISSLSCLVPRERSTKERVPSRQSYDALIKNYHPPTTKGALARHSLSPFPLRHGSSSSSFFSLLSRRHFVFLFISPPVPRKLNKPRLLRSRPGKLGRRIQSYSPRAKRKFRFAARGITEATRGATARIRILAVAAKARRYLKAPKIRAISSPHRVSLFRFAFQWRASWVK